VLIIDTDSAITQLTLTVPLHNWHWQCHYTIDTDSAITQYI